MRKFVLICLVLFLPLPARAEDPALAGLFERAGDLPLRQRLVREALRAKGIVE